MAPKNFRFHSLRFYNVTQMLAHQQRRYRSVFDESELGFLYCERWHQKLRLARMPHAARTPEARRTLLAEDIGAAALPEPGKTPGSSAYL
jgi:hypothetical protein